MAPTTLTALGLGLALAASCAIAPNNALAHGIGGQGSSAMGQVAMDHGSMAVPHHGAPGGCEGKWSGHHGQHMMGRQGHGPSTMGQQGHGAAMMEQHHSTYPMHGFQWPRQDQAPRASDPYRGSRVVPRSDLDSEDVRHFLRHRVERQGYSRLEVGKVEERDENTIVAEIVTAEGALVQRLEVDRHSGEMQEVE